METAGPSALLATGPRRLQPGEPSPALLALRSALDAELVAWSDREARTFAALTPALDNTQALDHQPAHIGRALNPEAQTFTLDFLAATEEERYALRLVEESDDPQNPVEWLMQVPELKRAYGFDTVAGLVVLRKGGHAQLQWQAALARAYDATYFVDSPADVFALQALARQIVSDLVDRVATVRLWDLWERERAESDQREYVLGKDLLAAYVPVDADPQDVAAASNGPDAWGGDLAPEMLLDNLARHLDALGMPYDREVPGGVTSPLLRRYLPAFHWPLVIDDRFSLLYLPVPDGPVLGLELAQWTTLARCTRYWLDKANDLRWNERGWVPLLVLGRPIVGPPYTPLSPLELLAGAGWCLVTPAELSTPERVRDVLARAGHHPSL